jgi:hypothetical protein
MTYAEKLKDPRWQKKRLEIMELDGWKCRFCGDADSTLHTHHLYYVSGRKPWEYSNDALVCLCCNCHEKQPTVPVLNPQNVTRFNEFIHQFDLPESENLMLVAGQIIKNKRLRAELIEERAIKPKRRRKVNK